MSELARNETASAAMERGSIPEVAALGNVLTGLFNTLGVSQAAYAHRVHLDKSAVSRYLSGKRLPPQAFIDRLLMEVQEHRESPVQEQVKEAIRQQRLRALQVTNPGEFELESLREDLLRSQRTVKMARRQIEALHDLLEKREQQISDLSSEFEQARIDWVAEVGSRGVAARWNGDPEHAASEYDRLREEVARLRDDLRVVQGQREEAEGRSRELKSQVLRLEEELAKELSGVGDQVPLMAFQEQLEALIVAENSVGVSLELSDAGRTRSYADLIHTYRWLEDYKRKRLSREFFTEVAKFRPIEDVEAFGADLLKRHSEELDRFLEVVVARVSGYELSYLFGKWSQRTVGEGAQLQFGRDVLPTSLSDILLASLLRHAHELDSVRSVLMAVHESDRFDSFPVASAVIRSDGSRAVTVGLARHIDQTGWASLARVMVGGLVRAKQGMRFFDWFIRLSQYEVDWLFDYIAADCGGWVVVEFANKLHQCLAEFRGLSMERTLEKFHDHVEQAGATRFFTEEAGLSTELRQYLVERSG
ncbi:hypothetical protein OG429_13725 [Streptomyces sp. NBC_00190]|uniref:hypothetical protein n=1 Tax=Streptomyces sp. NBC_00190 TaxID=2903634 RepID=UPI002E2D17D2|nr:hypothetical protein [Streptomyces sp. NBC_00190]